MKNLDEVFDERGLLRGEFIETDMEDILEAYHRRAAKVALAMSNGKVPLGLRQALKLPLTPTQLSKRYPFKVVVVHQGRRYETKCKNLGAAFALWSKYGPPGKGYNTTVVSVTRGYDIPPKLRGKLKGRWMWCPHCMKPRKFNPVYGETFEGLRKRWSSKKNRYEWVPRKLQLLECPLCGTSNRSEAFRRSNQKWEVRKVKRRARKVKRRHRTRRVGDKLRVVPVKKKRRQ